MYVYIALFLTTRQNGGGSLLPPGPTRRLSVRLHASPHDSGTVHKAPGSRATSVAVEILASNDLCARQEPSEQLRTSINLLACFEFSRSTYAGRCQWRSGCDAAVVAVAALAPARVEYSLDRRCPQQSLNPLGKRPLDHILHVFAAAGARAARSFSCGGARKKRSLGRCKSVKGCARPYPPCEAQPRRVALMLRLAAAEQSACLGMPPQRHPCITTLTEQMKLEMLARHRLL